MSWFWGGVRPSAPKFLNLNSQIPDPVTPEPRLRYTDHMLQRPFQPENIYSTGPLAYHVGYTWGQVKKGLDAEDSMRFQIATWGHTLTNKETLVLELSYARIIWHPGAGYVFLYDNELYDDEGLFADLNAAVDRMVRGMDRLASMV